MTAAPTTEHERLYRAAVVEPALVCVPSARFLAVDGEGAPGSPPFQEAIAALYAIAYTARFALIRAGGPKTKVPPLEGLYDADAEPAAFDTAARDRLRWTLALRLPEEIDDEAVDGARGAAAERRRLPGLDRVRVERFDEGECAQVLHVGPYSAEGETVELLHRFMRERGLAPRGRHHEIYLGDPRRARPERLRTILRQPVG